MSDQCGEAFGFVCEQGRSIPQDIGAWGGSEKGSHCEGLC